MGGKNGEDAKLYGSVGIADAEGSCGISSF
jgi:hypothetical protein